MDHVIASAPEDAAEAERLAEKLCASGLPGRFDGLAIEDETALEETLRQDRDGSAIYVLLLSRALSARIRSLVALDTLLGALLLGRRRIVASCLPGDREPSREVTSVVQRHDGITDETTLEGLARRIAGRLARTHVNHPAPFQPRRSSSRAPTLRYLLLGVIVLLLGVLALLALSNFKLAGRG